MWPLMKYLNFVQIYAYSRNEEYQMTRKNEYQMTGGKTYINKKIEDTF